MAKVMFVEAHQDDETAIAGYLSRLVTDHGYEGKIVCLTDGGAGFYKAKFLKDRTSLTEIRDEEASRSAAILGLEYERLTYKEDGEDKPFPDARLMKHLDAAGGAVWDSVRGYEPNLLISLPVIDPSSPFKIHPDHQTAALATRYLGYMVGVPGAYPECYSREFINSIKEGDELKYVDTPFNVWTQDGYSGVLNASLVFALTKDELDRKVRAWAEYGSQSGDWLIWVGNKGQVDNSRPPTIDELTESLIGRSNRLIEPLRGIEIEDSPCIDYKHFTTVPGKKNMLKFDPKQNIVYEVLTVTACFKKPEVGLVKSLLPGDIFDYQLAKETIRKLQQKK